MSYDGLSHGDIAVLLHPFVERHVDVVLVVGAAAWASPGSVEGG